MTVFFVGSPLVEIGRNRPWLGHICRNKTHIKKRHVVDICIGLTDEVGFGEAPKNVAIARDKQKHHCQSQGDE